MYMCAPWWSYFSVTLGQYLYHKMGQMTMFLINICNCLDVKRDGRMGSGKRNQRKETERRRRSAGCIGPFANIGILVRKAENCFLFSDI